MVFSMLASFQLNIAASTRLKKRSALLGSVARHAIDVSGLRLVCGQNPHAARKAAWFMVHSTSLCLTAGSHA